MDIAWQLMRRRDMPPDVNFMTQRVARWRNVLQFACRPPDAHLTRASDVLMVFEGDAIAFEDARGEQLQGAALSGKTAALVLFEDSCYDLSLTLPTAPLAEFEAMIRNEINFASPFPEEESHAFWRANERADGTWQVHIGVVLKSEVARALEAAAAHGVTLTQVVRLGEDEASSIYAAPAWLTGGHTRATSQTPHFPRALRLPGAALGVFALSVAAHLGMSALTAGDLRAEAAAADQQLRAVAATAGFHRQIADEVAHARQNIALLAQLSAALPAHTWLDRITLGAEKVRLVGFGPSGAETVRLLSGLPGIADPQTIGTVTRDNSQNVERFVIEFTLTGAPAGARKGAP